MLLHPLGSRCFEIFENADFEGDLFEERINLALNPNLYQNENLHK